FYDKLTLSLAFGGAPDLFVLHTGRFPEYASHNVLSPIDADLKAAGIAKTLYPEQTWRAASWEGQQYALPLDVHPMTLYWNKDLFAKAGITSPPTNYEEFLAAARKLTVDKNGDGKPEQWGFAFTNLASNATLFMNQFGTEMLTPDLNRSALGEAGSRAAYARMLDLIYKEKVAPKPEGQDAWLSFRNGKVAMVMEGVYMNNDLQQTKGLNYGADDVPQFGPKPAVWAGSHLLVLPRDAKPRQRTAAWTFARYVSEHSVEWAKGGQVPARSDVRDTPEFRALTVQATVASQLDRIVYDPPSVSINLVATYRDSMIEKILNRIGNEDEAIATAERRTNAVLDRQRSAQ
ncbi:extracellular solute-binding protein, partial [bacterium]